MYYGMSDSNPKGSNTPVKMPEMEAAYIIANVADMSESVLLKHIENYKTYRNEIPEYHQGYYKGIAVWITNNNHFYNYIKTYLDTGSYPNKKPTTDFSNIQTTDNPVVNITPEQLLQQNTDIVNQQKQKSYKKYIIIGAIVLGAYVLLRRK